MAMNFKRTEISDIIDRVGPQLGERFLYDSELSGRVTISVPRRVTRDEAWQLLHAALGMQGLGAFPMPGGGYKVLPLDAAGGATPWSASPSPTGEDRVVTLVSVDDVPASELLGVLRPILERTTVAVALPSNDGIILATSQRRLAGLASLIHALDERGHAELRLRRLDERAVGQVLEVFEARFPRRRPAYSRVQAWADERTNTLIYRAPVALHETIEALFDELERPVPSVGEIAVLRVEHVDAEEIAQQLRMLAEGESRTGSAGASQGASEALQARSSRIAGREFTVVADPPTSSLVVRASPSIIDLVREVVDKLDRPPRQIAVEILVQEWIYEKNTTLSIGGVTAIGDVTGDFVTLQSLPGGAFDTLPVPAAFAVQVTNLPHQIQMIADESEVQALTIMQPHLILLSGEEDLLFSGNNIPVPRAPSSPESVLSGNTLTQTTVIERYDIGVELLVRATIGEGHTARLDLTVNLENLRSSLAGDPAEVGPTFTTREVETTVDLLPNQALVIAGDTEGFNRETRVGVPFLMDIPFLGALFSATVRERREARIIIAAQAFALPDAASLAAYRLEREIAFEQARSERLLLSPSSGAAFTVRVTRGPSEERALALARAIETVAHPARVLRRESDTGPLFDVYLLGFDSYLTAADRAFALSGGGRHPRVIPLATLGRDGREAPASRAPDDSLR